MAFKNTPGGYRICGSDPLSDSSATLCNSDLSNPYIYSIFALLLRKQICEKNKSLSAASESWPQFWPKITPDCFKKTNALANKTESQKLGNLISKIGNRHNFEINCQYLLHLLFSFFESG